MGQFFKPNIDHRGRIVRLIWGIGCIIAGCFILKHVFWLALACFAGGLFAFFEAVRGWCLMRACGIKTRM